jgi:hypothetical protein
MTSLGMTILGTSSELHAWDPASETFVAKGSKEILLDGRDGVISNRLAQPSSSCPHSKILPSVMCRFLAIGTLMRRLEILILTFRSRRVGFRIQFRNGASSLEP